MKQKINAETQSSAEQRGDLEGYSFSSANLCGVRVSALEEKP
jgi:hypothetical protein